MKKTAKLKIGILGLRLVFWVILIAEYVLGVDFINRCGIQSDTYYFASCGFALLFVLMSGIIIWCMFFDHMDKKLVQSYNKCIQRERYEKRQAHIERVYKIHNEQMHKVFNNLEASRNEEDNK